MMQAFLVAAGGFFGAICRFGVGQLGKKMVPSPFPYATLFINLSGSFLLGWLTGMNVGDSIKLFFSIGFMGAYTTFSTFTLENVQLYRNKQYKLSILYLATSLILGLMAAYAGFMVSF